MSSQLPPNPNVETFNNDYWIPSTDQDSQTLQEVLIQGNSAGAKSINMNANNITNGGQITAIIFNGDLNGNASTATTATNALACSGNSATATTATNALACSGNSATATTATNALACSGNSASATLVSVSGTIPTAVYNVPVCSSTGNQQLRTNLQLQYDTTVSPPTLSTNLNGRADTAINITLGSGGQVLYQSSANTTAKLTNGTTGQVLQSNGGTSAPSWTTNINGSAGTATTATNVSLTTDNTSGTYFIPFAKAVSSSQALFVDNTTGPLTYNPDGAILSTTTFQGALNGTASNALQATNQASGVAIPAMYFYNAYISGGGSSESGTVSFSALPNTDYMVFSSIYYGYSGSSGTYNATNSSGAINTMIINTITTTSFNWVFTRSSGDNLAVFAVFMLVRSPSLNFTKSY